MGGIYSENSNKIICDTTENERNEISTILDKLSTILQCLEIVKDKSMFNSAKCFKPCEEQLKDCDEFQVRIRYTIARQRLTVP